MSNAKPLLCAAVLALGASIAGAHAAAAYPQRPIRFLVPQATGGGSDTIARYMAQKLSENLGQQIVITEQKRWTEIIKAANITSD